MDRSDQFLMRIPIKVTLFKEQSFFTKNMSVKGESHLILGHAFLYLENQI